MHKAQTLTDNLQKHLYAQEICEIQVNSLKETLFRLNQKILENFLTQIQILKQNMYQCRSFGIPTGNIIQTF